jgi:hypothetical protein
VRGALWARLSADAWLGDEGPFLSFKNCLGEVTDLGFVFANPKQSYRARFGFVLLKPENSGITKNTSRRAAHRQPAKSECGVHPKPIAIGFVFSPRLCAARSPDLASFLWNRQILVSQARLASCDN